MRIDVTDAVEAWLPAFGLPPDPGSGVKDLSGTRVRVPRFKDEETVRFFFPRRTLVFHQAMIKRLTVGLRKRGAKIDTVLPTAEDYARWLGASGLEDSPERRYGFASNPP